MYAIGCFSRLFLQTKPSTLSILTRSPNRNGLSVKIVTPPNVFAVSVQPKQRLNLNSDWQSMHPSTPMPYRQHNTDRPKQNCGVCDAKIWVSIFLIVFSANGEMYLSTIVKLNFQKPRYVQYNEYFVRISDISVYFGVKLGRSSYPNAQQHDST